MDKFAEIREAYSTLCVAENLMARFGLMDWAEPDCRPQGHAQLHRALPMTAQNRGNISNRKREGGNCIDCDSRLDADPCPQGRHPDP
jgi:hypothetical protein